MLETVQLAKSAQCLILWTINLQIGEYLVKHKYLCLSWDATSMDGSHVNANVTTLLVLDVCELPGGTAVDYTDHVTSVLTEIAFHYAKFSGQRQEDVLSQIHTNISSALTDRVNVNSAAVRLLEEAMECSLLDLKCNVHPLETMGLSCNSATKKANDHFEIKGDCRGLSGAGPSVIFAVCKFNQGDQKYSLSCMCIIIDSYNN